MRLILKHILRSARRSFIQSLIIVATVALSTALAVAAFSVMVEQNKSHRDVALLEQEIGDVLLSTRSDSDARILFAEDVEQAVLGYADVTGEFSLVGFMNIENEQGEPLRSMVSVAAADLEDIDRFYKFEYCAYGSFNNENIDTSVLISESFAKKAGLSLGDTVVITLVDEELSYTVEAIAKDSGIFNEREMLISFSGFMKTVSEKIPSVSVLGDSFEPCSRVMVKVNDGVSAEQVVDILSNDKKTSDKNITFTDHGMELSFWMLIRSITITTFMILIFLLAAFLVGTALTLLQKKRREEFARFSAVGASDGQLRVCGYFECAVYAIVGIVIGAILAFPTTRLGGSFFGWSLTPSPMALTVGAGAAFILIAACAVRHSFKNEKKSPSAESGRGAKKYISVGVFFALIAAIFILPVEYRYIASISALLVTAYLAFALAPKLLSGVAVLLERRAERKDVCSAPRLLGSKNVGRNFAYSFSCGLLAVLISILSVIVIFRTVLSNQSEIWGEGIGADAVAYGLNESAETEIANIEGVDKTLRIYYNTNVIIEGESTAAALSISGDPSGFLNEKILPKEMPSGNGAAISAGLAGLLGVKTGDSISIDIGGAVGTFEITEILWVNNNIFYFDSEAIGIRQNTVFVDFEDGADKAQTYETVVSLVEADGAYASDDPSIFGNFSNDMNGYTSLLFYAMMSSIFLGLLGVVNVLLQLSGERRAERVKLIECGMEKKDAAKMSLYELIVMTVAAVAVAAIAFSIMCIMIDIALRSFGLLLFTA